MENRFRESAAATPTVSVVIPAFNRVLFLETCVESVLRQTFTDFEICLVDDGSTDGTGALCDMLARRCGKVRAVHRPNGGVTAARAAGVALARGRWVTFVDSDDSLPADALERLVGKASERTDIVVGSFGNKRRWIFPVCPIREYRKQLIVGRFNIGAACGKLVRRSLFDEHTFDLPREIVVGEDLIMHLRLAFATEKPVVRVSGSVYEYVQHGGNVTHAFRNTPGYEQEFFRHCLLSIPAAERSTYLPATVRRRLRMVRRMRRAGTLRAGDVHLGVPFFRQLQADMAACGYRPAWRDAWALLGTDRAPFARRCMAWLRSLFGMPERRGRT